MKGKMIIAFFIAIFLLSLFPYNITEIVGATYITSSYGFENGTPAQQVTLLNSGFFYSSRHLPNSYQFNVSSSGARSGTKAFYLGTSAAKSSIGYFNFSYSATGYLTNFSFYQYLGGTPKGSYYFYFYNQTHTPMTASNISGAKCMIVLQELTTDMYISNLNEVGGANVFGSVTHFAYHKITFNIDDDIGTVTYGYDNVYEVSVARNPVYFTNGYRIDRCIIYYNGGYVLNNYIDDINFTVGTSYTGGGGGSGGCIDTSGMDYYSKNIEVFDSYLDISSPFIEFTSHSSLSLTPEVFELWVGSALYEGDSDTSNYFLYINGLSVGNPICFYLLSGQTYVLQWDLSSFSPISEEVLVFELAHTITFDGSHYWNIARATANLLYGPPSPTMITYKNTGTNGVLDGTPEYSGSCWKLYFSAFGTPEDEENTDFDVGINLIGFNTHPTYNTPYSFIYETIYFEVFSNRTDNYYHLNISKGAVTQGNEQGYPKDIYSYHVIHGYTPTTEGNYTVSLCRDSNNVIVDHKHFNITTKTVDYAIWTFPNPSNTGVNHGVTVYISDDTVFQNYYVSGVVDEDLVNNFNSSDRKIIVGTLDGNKYWSTSLITFAISGWEYWRLWGTNDNISFIPLTSPYLHYVNSLTQNNYIRTSLTNGEGYTGESFNVYGQHSYILSQLSVYLDNKPIKDVSTNVSFLIPYSFSNVGTHTFSLRVFNDGVWEIVDSVVVSIVIKPSGGGELGGMLPPPYSYIMGAIITIVLMILPSIALGKIGISGSESLKYVPIFSGTMGFILSCLIGFFPWYSIFALLFVLILIIVALYLAKSKQ
jgi:hypothetical protein